jgi:DNA replication protein DnaC
VPKGDEETVLRRLYKHTLANPQIVSAGTPNLNAGTFVTFVQPCMGDSCEGYLLYRYGPDGEYAKQVPCPFHLNRFSGNEEPVEDLDPSGHEAMQQRREVIYQEADVPVFFQPYTLENWPGSDIEARSRAFDYCRQATVTSGLLVMGRFGVGKTSLAVSIIAERTRRYGDSALFITAPDLLDGLRQGGFDANEEFLTKLRRRRLLVIDDLGAERSNKEWAQEQLWKVIGYRHDHRLATVCTTNLQSSLIWEKLGWTLPDDSDTLEDRAGERLVQRFLDKEAFEIVVVGGRNLRTK